MTAGIGKAAALALVLALAACSDVESGESREELKDQVADLEDQVETLTSELQDAREQLEDVREKSETVTAASADLEDQVGRLRSEDWRDVVPDIDTAQQDVDGAQAALADAAGEQ